MDKFDRINTFTRRIPPALNIIGFSIPSFSVAFLEAFFASYFFFYYEIEIGIPPAIVALIYLIISNVMLLLPLLLGYLSDRNYGFTRKLGRRFFWLLISGISLPAFIFFMFFPTTFVPGVGLIMLLILLGYKVIHSIFTLNYSALLVNKFQNPKERLIMGTIIENLRTFGTFLSLILIPMFLEYGNPLTYKIGALIAAIIFIITFLLGVPGLLEESELIETYYSPNLEPQGGFFTEFFRRFGCVFTKKNYFIYVLRTIGTGAVSFFFFGGIFYYTEIILGMSSYFISYMNLSYFGMIIISIPIGFLMSWFLGYVRVFNIAGFSLGTTILLFPLLGFIPLTAVILMAAVGFFSGISFTCFIPIEGDIFDESASRHRKRSEGFFYGSFALFGGSMTIYVFPIIMTFIHTITGFVPYYGPQPASAIVGIWILFSIIPGLMLIGTQFVFLFVYDLKPRKVEAIQQTLKDLGI